MQVYELDYLLPVESLRFEAWGSNCTTSHWEDGFASCGAKSSVSLKPLTPCALRKSSRGVVINERLGLQTCPPTIVILIPDGPTF